MRRRLAALLAGVAVGVACGPVDPPQTKTYVTNECPCAAYKQPAPLTAPSCSNGICVSNRSMDPILVLSLPETSRDYPGVTMAVSRSALVSPDTRACNGACVQLPAPAGDTGSLALDAAVGLAAGIGVDFGNGGNRTSIPVQVVYYPVSRQSVSGATGVTTTFVDPMEMGLPLLPSRALSGGASVPGPSGSAGYGWRLSLGPGDYERDIVPVDDRFPPSIDYLHLASVREQEQGFAEVDDQATPANRQLTVVWPERDLRGFRAYLRDRTTHRRASSRVTITDVQPGPLTLNTFHIPAVGATSANLEKVLEPPDGLEVPTYADPLIPGDTVGTAAIPILPAAVAVSGLLEVNGVPVEGDLIFESTPYDPTTRKGGITIVPDPTPNPVVDRDAGQRALHYATTAHSTPNGHYEVVLPPGEYEIFARPSDPAVGGGASAVHPPFAAGAPARAQTISAASLGVLRGVVRVADGRALSDAVVEARPSSSLASSGVDPRKWPRVRSTTTDADGAYVLPVDPGAIDLFVRPVPGTGFPVTTALDLDVTAGETKSVDPITVPAPVAIDLVLHDTADNPVVDALVRAFLVPSGATPPAPNLPPAAIEVGAWRSDASGHLQMLLVPPAVTPAP